MGLLSKALEYRKNYLKNKPKGLLARALAYRELNDLNSFPEAKDVQPNLSSGLLKILQLRASNDIPSNDLLDSEVKDKNESIYQAENNYSTDEIELDIEIPENTENLQDKIDNIVNERLQNNEAEICDEVEEPTEEFADDEIIEDESETLSDETGICDDVELPTEELDDDEIIEDESETLSDNTEICDDVDLPAEELADDEIIEDESETLSDETEICDDVELPTEEFADDEIIKDESETLSDNTEIYDEIEEPAEEFADDEIIEDETETLSDETETCDNVELPAEELDDDEISNDIDLSDEELADIIDINNDIRNTTNGIIAESDNFEISYNDENNISQDKSETDSPEEREFFECINQLSLELSTLPQEKGAMQLFHSMTSLSFGFSKSSLFLFSPSHQQFQCCEFENLDEESINKLHFSVDFENLYQETAENGYFFITKENDRKGILSSFLSEKDFEDVDFLLLVPYIFTSRMIGLFAGFKLHGEEKLTPTRIEALSLVCRLNAALLYSLYQTESLITEMEEKKKNQTSIPESESMPDDESIDISEIDNSPEIETDDVEESSEIDESFISDDESAVNEEVLSEANEDSDFENEIEECPEETSAVETQNDNEKFQSFDDKYHKILFYLQKTIESSPGIPLSILKIQLINTDSLEKQIDGFKINIFISDIQFIVMNIVGANGLVSMFDDFSIYAILPEADSEIASMLLDKITADVKNMFSEIFGNCTVEFANNAINYPADSQDFAELFYLAQNGK
jgi:hypothetical protein